MGVAKMCANPQAASETYKYLLSHAGAGRCGLLFGGSSRSVGERWQLCQLVVWTSGNPLSQDVDVTQKDEEGCSASCMRACGGLIVTCKADFVRLILQTPHESCATHDRWVSQLKLKLLGF